MDELQVALRAVLANTFFMYYKAHAFHWNVMGPLFPQLHAFFGDLYAELHGAVDPIAEHIRATGGFPPGSLMRLREYATVEENTATIPSATSMAALLLTDNTKVIASLKVALASAESAGESGLANFLQDRLDIHAKHGWMLKATATAM